jgi:uncharacterized membrane protein
MLVTITSLKIPRMTASRLTTDEATKNPPGELNLDQISQNIEAILDFYAREEQKISASQRFLERLSGFIGQPIFLGIILLFVLIWISANCLAPQFGLIEFDPAPFSWLQGLVTLSALLTSTIVLIKQNRLARMDEMRAHLDLKVTLLTEQKAAKMIDLLEELRRDLPNVKNRDDSHAAALTQAMNPDLVVAALEEISVQEPRIKPVKLEVGDATSDA